MVERCSFSMHRFGAQIIAKSPESSAIIQPIVTEPVGAAVAKLSRFGRLIGFFREHRHTEATLPPGAEMICRISRISAGQPLSA
jgi:hypothetical protein